jgi:cysteine-rich repeat protein
MQTTRRPPRRQRPSRSIVVVWLTWAALLAVPTPASSAGIDTGTVVMETTATGSTLTHLPPGVRAIVMATDTHDGVPQSVSATIRDQPEAVLVQLRGLPLARVAAPNAPAARQALAVIRQRAVAAIVRIASAVQRRTLTRDEVIRREYTRVFHGFAARLSPAMQAQVRALSDVQAIYPDVEMHTTAIDPGVSMVEAPAFWSTYAYRGAGKVLAVVDTGIDYTHPDLGGCFGPGCKVRGGYDFVNSDADPLDDNGHGTHVAAIATGNGALLGVAPEAALLAYKICTSSGVCAVSDAIAGIDRAVDPNDDGDTSDHADVINLSIGGPGDPNDAISQAVDNATAAGVLVAAAAGNSGPTFGSVGSPGAARTALTVGAVEGSETIASFSSRGPTSVTYTMKPEIVAPGVNVCAAQALNTVLGPSCIDAAHVLLSGTSMATPHVAGAATLVRGLLPLLSPAEVKSLLVQNSVDLGYAALVQGAGRLDVLAAAQGRTTATPAAVSFGLDDLTQTTWHTSQALTVRNIDTVGRSYTLSTAALPAGIATVLTPSSFTLGAGETQVVTFDLSVDNTVFPSPPAAPHAYDTNAVLIDSGNQQQRVPFVFLKAGSLHLSFDQAPQLVLVHNRGTLSVAARPSSTSQDFLVPDGTYDAVAVFDNAFVVHEGIVVNNVGMDSIDSTEAVHQITFTMRDEADQVLTARLSMLKLVHQASDMGILLAGQGAVPAVSVNTLSTAYALTIEEESLIGTTEYVSVDGIRSGVSTDHALGNHAADLTFGEVRDHPNPLHGDNVTLINFLDTLNLFGFGFAIGHGDPWNGLTEQVYISRPPFTPFPLFTQKVLQNAAGTFAHSSGFIQGSTTTGTLNVFDYQTFGLAAGSPAVFSTATGELPLNLGPPLWSDRLENTGTTVRVTFPFGDYCLSFHNQGGDPPDGPGGGIPYTLTAGDAFVTGGLFPHAAARGCTLTPPVDPPLTVAPGSYELHVGPLAYFAGGLGATTQTTASFDTTAVDPSPPWMGALTLRSAGALTDTVVPGTPVNLGVQVNDEHLASVAVTYRSATQTFALPVTATGANTYEATLPTCPPGGVDLTVTATDEAGNVLRQEWAPAFACRLASCGNGTPDPGEVCDDGNIVSGDGCNSTCTSQETCGNGVADLPAEQCDDGNTVNGDGCSSTCSIELGWTCIGSASVCTRLAPTPTPPATPTASATVTPTPQATSSPTGTATQSPTRTRTASPSVTPTRTVTRTFIHTATPTSTRTATASPSPTSTPTPTVTNTPSPTRSATATPSVTPVATASPTPTTTPSGTSRPTASVSPTPSATPTPSPSATEVPVPVDAVLLPIKPLTVTIGSGRTEATRAVTLTVRNPDPVARTLTVGLDADATHCPAAVAGAPHFDNGQASILVPAGSIRRAKVSLLIRSSDFTSFNAKAPTRCTLAFTATVQVSGSSRESSPGNGIGRLELNVLNRNNPEQTAQHETWIRSRRPATMNIARGALTAAKKFSVVVGNADYRPIAENPGDAIAVSTTSDCAGLSLSPPVCTTATLSTTVLVRGGATKACRITATAAAGEILTPNRLSPQRCTVTVRATGPSDPQTPPLDASNNTTQLVIDVVDKND